MRVVAKGTRRVVESIAEFNHYTGLIFLIGPLNSPDNLDNHPCLAVGVLTRQTYQGGTRGSRLCGGGSPDLELEGMREDTRHIFIHVRAARVADPTCCVGYQVWRPALGCWSPEGLGI